jgi:hypothetical protein
MILVDGILVDVTKPTDEEWESGIIAHLSIETPDGSMVDIDCIEVDDKLKPEAYSIAKKIFIENKFAGKFNHFEWAWKIGLDLDYDMYQLALKSQTQESTFDKLLKDSRLNDNIILEILSDIDMKMKGFEMTANAMKS